MLTVGLKLIQWLNLGVGTYHIANGQSCRRDVPCATGPSAKYLSI
jgi:hypothetical protein